MQEPKDDPTEPDKPSKHKTKKPDDVNHLGSSNAFEETESPLSRDSDDISDEKLDELLEE